ncbi:MAG: tRNA lysidine(34) synthetase TilS [Polyangiales bacterium]
MTDLSLPALVLGTIRRRCLWGRGAEIVIAVSGGGDSVALMHLLSELAPRLALTLRVASVDHGLRLESADEVRMVGVEAARLGLPFTPIKLELAEGANVQARGREARYASLHALAKETGAFVALGHTLDDQAETVMGRILRGAGLRGLGGVQPQRDDGVVRPLIDVRRDALRAYLCAKGASWVEDPSNELERFERVRIRRALATFESEDPKLSVHLAELADDAREAHEVLESLASALGPELDSLAHAPSAVRRVAIRRLAEGKLGKGVRRRHLEDLERCVLSRTGEVLLGGGWRASPRDGVLHFEKGDWSGRSG